MKDTAEQRVTFEQLLSEDTLISARRKELQDRHSRLTKIKAILDDFKHLELAPASISSSPTEEMEEQEDDDATSQSSFTNPRE
ncbi:hypothetical protein CPB83DRAFT_604827 [Crepidotus variabilis]|uniref:GED domain-containing protein n=1 Tax=Crepidotus variabilis TaxID=179855 RepID=A0A9P6JKR5_9AGAR|nr:hypothetical protein CPB83DRAFT_604827 [Crepidotus variabilis]